MLTIWLSTVTHRQNSEYRNFCSALNFKPYITSVLEVTAARYKIRHGKCVCILAVDWFPGYPALPPSSPIPKPHSTKICRDQYHQ